MTGGALATGLALALATAPAGPPATAGRGPRVQLAAPTVVPVGPYSLPVPATLVAPPDLRAPHHDYPASDLMVPIGTPVFAAHGGRVALHEGERCGLGVTVAGLDGRRYVSCHLSALSVSDGIMVAAGDVLGLSGDTGNARGIPHLHFHVVDAVGYLCPQALLLAWYEGREGPERAWRVRDGCFFARDRR